MAEFIETPGSGANAGSAPPAPPGAHIWCAEKQPRVVIEPGAAQMPGNPGP